MTNTGDTTYTKVFIGGLRWETTAEKLREHFGQYGEIIDSNVIIDRQTNRSRGYGFVTFASPEAAAKATTDPFPTIDGRKANCNLAALGAKNKSTGPQAGGPGYGGGGGGYGGGYGGAGGAGGYPGGYGGAAGGSYGGYGYGQGHYGQGYAHGYHPQSYGYQQYSQPFQAMHNNPQQPGAMGGHQEGYDYNAGNGTYPTPSAFPSAFPNAYDMKHNKDH